MSSSEDFDPPGSQSLQKILLLTGGSSEGLPAGLPKTRQLLSKKDQERGRLQQASREPPLEVTGWLVYQRLTGGSSEGLPAVTVTGPKVKKHMTFYFQWEFRLGDIPLRGH